MGTHGSTQRFAETAAPLGRARPERRRTMQRTMARLYTGLAWVILAGLLFQFYLAGTALFGATTFEAHRSLGMALVLPVVALLLLAVAGRMGRRLISISALLLVLTVVQILLPGLRDNVSWVAALHPVNALALGGVTSLCARAGRTWTRAQGPIGEPAEVASR